jgi:hypothetical protein
LTRRRYARLPRPTTIAAPPTTNSVPSCSPAVPPPPVWGAPCGGRCVGELGATCVNVGDGEAVADGLGAPVAVEVGLAVEVGFAVLVGVAFAVPPDDLGADAEGVADGVNIVGCVPAPVHAVAAMETRTVNVAVPTAEAARIFMKPPSMSGNGRYRFRPANLARRAAEGMNCCPRQLRQVCVQWRDFHLTIRLRE